MSDDLSEAQSQHSRLHFVGGRYEAPGYPLSTIAELSTYERLVLGVAKEMYLDANPSRKRLPKHFSDQHSFRVTKIVDASATPVLQLSSTDSTLDVSAAPTLIDAAQDRIDDAFNAIISSGVLPRDFPPRQVDILAQLGRTLSPAESIMFGPSKGSGLKYTQKTRKALLASLRIDGAEISGQLVGRITAVDTNSQSFTFTGLNGDAHAGKYRDEGKTDDLVEVTHNKELAPIVRLDCSYKISHEDKIISIDDVFDIEVFLSQSLDIDTQRLIELYQLPEGWLDGEGQKVDILALEMARDTLIELAKSQAPVPSIFPREDGTILLQWFGSGGVISCYLTPDEPILIARVDPASGSSGEASVADLSDVYSELRAYFSEGDWDA